MNTCHACWDGYACKGFAVITIYGFDRVRKSEALKIDTRVDINFLDCSLYVESCYVVVIFKSIISYLTNLISVSFLFPLVVILDFCRNCYIARILSFGNIGNFSNILVIFIISTCQTIIYAIYFYSVCAKTKT